MGVVVGVGVGVVVGLVVVWGGVGGYSCVDSWSSNKWWLGLLWSLFWLLLLL